MSPLHAGLLQWVRITNEHLAKSDSIWPLLQVPDVSVDEHAVHLWVNRLYQDLEAVEGTSFGDLNLLAEPLYLLDKKTEMQIETMTI